MACAAFILFLLTAPFLTMIGRRWWTLRRRQRAMTPSIDRCRCGYRLEGLDTVRCPECGRVFGFDATAEELELTDEQLRRAKVKRDERAAAAAEAAAYEDGANA